MQFFYNHLIPKQCQKKKKKSIRAPSVCPVVPVLVKNQPKNWRQWFLMESMKRVISLMPLRTRAKHNIHSRFRKEVWMCQQCCPILSLGHDLMLLIRSCWDEVSSSKLLWQAFWCVSSYLSKNKTLWLGMNAVQDWNETCLRFCLDAFSFLSAGVSANTKKKPCCVSLLSFLKACPRDSIKRGLQRQWCWCYSRELRVP